ncbi:MAG: hypothetical protein VB112_07290 [Oscillospiraceae bacterium]|nr:hypothetical protein [Oscillospiraceae bacterium]
MSTLIRKLSSRKLWVAIAGVTAGIALIVSGNVSEGSVAVVSAVVAYMLAEGMIDAAAAKTAAETAETIASAAVEAAKAVGEKTAEN